MLMTKGLFRMSLLLNEKRAQKEVEENNSTPKNSSEKAEIWPWNWRIFGCGHQKPTGYIFKNIFCQAGWWNPSSKQNYMRTKGYDHTTSPLPRKSFWVFLALWFCLATIQYHIGGFIGRMILMLITNWCPNLWEETNGRMWICITISLPHRIHIRSKK